MHLRKIMLALFFGSSLTAAAQGPTYTVEPGQRVNDVLQPADYFLYPDFSNGEVHFKDGYISRARLNYSFSEAALQFIAPKGDTLVLANEEKIQLVAVGKDTFYFHQGFLQQIARVGDTRLLLRQYLKIHDVSRVGGYGANETGAMDQTTRYNANNQVRELVLTSRLTIMRQQDLFLWAPDDEAPVPASRKELERRQPKRKSDIAAYLKERKVDFSQLQPVLRLMQHLQQAKPE